MNTTRATPRLVNFVLAAILTAIMSTASRAGDLTVDNMTVMTNAIVYGKMGIGTNPPTSRLDVNGDVMVRSNLVVSGTITGNGSTITSINASNLTSGTVPTARLSGITTNQMAATEKTRVDRAITNNQGNVTLSGTFTGSGAGLTSLNAANLSSGTVPLARLSGIASNQIAAATDAAYRNGTPVTNHAALANLSYTSSGHTGFQPAGNYLTNGQVVGTASNALSFQNWTNGVLLFLGNAAGNTITGQSSVAIGTYAANSSSGNYFNALGNYAGYSSRGTNWNAFGNYAGQYANGNYWSTYGMFSGSYAAGNNWSAFGYAAGNRSTGDYWTAIGGNAGFRSAGTNNLYLGNFSGRGARGDNKVFIDTFPSDPGDSHIATNESIVIDCNGNGNLYLGRPNGTVTLRGSNVVVTSGFNLIGGGNVITNGQIVGTASNALKSTDFQNWTNSSSIAAGEGARVGGDSVSIGNYAGYSSAGHSGNTAIGSLAGLMADGNMWTAIGYEAGANYNGGPHGACWTALGSDAGFYADGNYWTALGSYAGYQTQGDQWNAIGINAGYQSRGDYWSAFGHYAGAMTVGDKWLALGYVAGYGTMGTNNTYIGSWAGRSARGNNRMYFDTYTNDPGVAHDPMTESIVIDGTSNGVVYIGRPNGEVRLRGSNISMSSGTSQISNLWVKGYATIDGTFSVGLSTSNPIVANGGQLGIGTSSPWYTLHLKKPTSEVVLEATPTKALLLGAYESDDKIWMSAYGATCKIGTEDAYPVSIVVGGSEKLRIHANGNTVISGNTTNTGTMTVTGAARFNGGIVYSPPMGDISMGSFTNAP